MLGNFCTLRKKYGRVLHDEMKFRIYVFMELCYVASYLILIKGDIYVTSDNHYIERLIEGLSR